MSNAGWYDDGAGRQRWWDGQQWTDHYQPPQFAQTQQMVSHHPGASDVRRARLNQAVADYVRNGWRVESQGDGYAVVVFGNRPNHILHLILTLVTFGLWAIIWIIIALSSGEKRRTIQVDDFGNVITT